VVARRQENPGQGEKLLIDHGITSFRKAERNLHERLRQTQSYPRPQSSSYSGSSSSIVNGITGHTAFDPSAWVKFETSSMYDMTILIWNSQNTPRRRAFRVTVEPTWLKRKLNLHLLQTVITLGNEPSGNDQADEGG
jgi:hypothetical protein